MDTFETVISDFCEKAGLARPPVKDGSVDFVVDGLCVSVQYRPDRDDCVMFTLPLYDTEPEPCLMRRALELSVNGAATGGHVLGINRILSIAGGVLLISSLAVGLYAVRSVSGMPSALEWTLTLCGGYALLVGPVFLVVLVSLLLSSLLRRRCTDNDSKGKRLVRVWLSTLASAACLLLSALWIAVSRGGLPLF